MKRYAVVGMGLITGRDLGQSGRMLQAEAARLAIEDAGLDRSQVKGAIDLQGAGGHGTHAAFTDAFPRILGLPANFYCTVGRGSGLASWGATAAMGFLDMGIADYIVLAYSTDAFSRAQGVKTQIAGKRTSIEREGYWGSAVGDTHAASSHAMFASRHMHEYGTTTEQLGSIAVQTRQWAQKNPLARFHGRPMTLEDYLNSPYVVYPYRLPDICTVSDGGVAFVLTSEERAQDHPNPPIWIHGIGFGEHLAEQWWDKTNYTNLAINTAKAQAFGQAGITLGDIDSAQLADCFTTEVVMQLEGYGYCGKGEGGPYAAEGHIGPGGDTPLNTSGGWLSAYHLCDMAGFSEAILQLRGQAGDRQILDCDFVLVSGHGGEVVRPGMCSMHSSLILGNSRPAAN